MRYITAQGVRGEFFMTVEKLRAQWLDRIVSRFDSDSAAENYAWLGTPPGLIEIKGEKRGEEVAEYEMTIRNRTFQGGISFKREDIERDKTGMVTMIRTREFAERCANQDIDLISDLMLAGSGSTLGLAYDKKNFFAANHSSHKSGTQKNFLTKTAVLALQVVAPTTPTAKESMAAILGVVAHMLGLKDDQGKPANSNAQEFMVMTSPALWQYLIPATVNAVINQGDTNTIASLAADGFRIRAVQNPLLTYTVEFDVYRTDAQLKPYAIQEEIPLEADVFDETSEYYRTNDRMHLKAYTRKTAFFARWEYAAHATLST